MLDTKQWMPCTTPTIGDTLKWNEPLWAPPNKPRGKRDKIGEQEIVGELVSLKDVLEFKVISAKKISTDNSKISVKEHDMIKRKLSSIEKENCQKLITEPQDKI